MERDDKEPIDPRDIGAVGSALIRAAEASEPSSQERMEELFPYIYEASRKMSIRGISRWLGENSGFEVSPSTVSRALRNPEKYWRGFLEFLEPRLRIIVEFTGQDAGLLLSHICVFDEILDECAALHLEEGETREELVSAAYVVRERWFGLSESTRTICLRYFTDVMEKKEVDDE